MIPTAEVSVTQVASPPPNELSRRRSVRFDELIDLRAIHRPQAHQWSNFAEWRQPAMRDYLAVIPVSGFESLEHELYPYMETMDPLSTPKFGVSLLEQTAADQWTEQHGTRPPRVTEWLALIRQIHPEAVWRRQDVFIADARGRPVIRLCDAETMSRLLAQHDALPASTCADLSFALYEYVLINNLHPLTDGNGRLSRMVLNLRLRALYRHPSLYLPIKEACLHARAGYEIALRQVELQGRWAPFHDFMRNLFDLLFAAGHRVGSVQ